MFASTKFLVRKSSENLQWPPSTEIDYDQTPMWRKLRIAVLLAGSLAASLVPASAHHSLDAEFNREAQLRVTGLVTKLEWMNPHVWLFLDVRDAETGKATRWALQLPSPNMLSRQGWSPEPFKSGTVVIVDGYRAKDGSRRGLAREVTSSEGKKLFVSGPARIL